VCAPMDQCHLAGVCDPATGHCTNPAATDGTACNDDNACTTLDSCSSGQCVGGLPTDCNDGNLCTDDSCDPIAGCTHTNNTAPCSDGDACTNGDACVDGTCHGGSPLDCDDGNPCTVDSCDPSGGCIHRNDPACTTDQLPDCSAAIASTAEVWPPNHRFVDITIQGITDPDGDPVTVTITNIMQDEPVSGPGSGRTCPDGVGIGSSTAHLRAERSSSGDGRVYHVSFSASDGRGGMCTATVRVCVPKDHADHACGDQGPIVDSLGSCVTTPGTGAGDRRGSGPRAGSAE
jgi:hypothetical protein